MCLEDIILFHDDNIAKDLYATADQCKNAFARMFATQVSWVSIYIVFVSNLAPSPQQPIKHSNHLDLAIQGVDCVKA